MMHFDPSSPHYPLDEIDEVAHEEDSDEATGDPGFEAYQEAASAHYAVDVASMLVDARTHDYALRDAAARFEETRRLAIELASMQKQLDSCRQTHEADLLKAVEREAVLSAQLAATEQAARSSESREAVELGARAQVAAWRCTQAQKHADEAEAERRRALESLESAEVSLAKAQAERDAMQRAKDSAQAQAREHAMREAELARQLEREKAERKAERESLSERTNAAVGEATAGALTARQQQQEAQHALELAVEARERAEARMEAHAAAASAADARAVAAEMALEGEMLGAERQMAACMQREQGTAEQLAALRREAAAERARATAALDEAAQLLDEQTRSAAEQLRLEELRSLDALEKADEALVTARCGADEALETQQQQAAAALADERQQAADELAGKERRAAEALAEAQREAAEARREAAEARGEAAKALDEAQREAAEALGEARREAAAALEAARREAAEALSQQQQLAEGERATWASEAAEALAAHESRAAEALAALDALEGTTERLLATVAEGCVAARSLCHRRAALGAWRDATTERARRQRERVHGDAEGAVRTALRVRSLRLGLHAWRTSVGASAHAAPPQRRRATTHAAVGRVHARALRRAVRAWEAAAEVAAARRCRHAGGACVLWARRQRRALRRWLSHLHMRQRLGRSERCFLHRGMRAAFGRWRRGPDNEDLARVVLLHRCAAATRQHGLHRAWALWAPRTTTRVRRGLWLRGALGEWSAKRMRRAWSTWYALVAGARARCRRVTSAHRQQQAAAWRQWAGTAAERQRASRCLLWAAGCLRYRGTRRAFSTWRGGSEGEATRLALRSMLHKAATVIRRREERIAFACWHHAYAYACGRVARTRLRIGLALEHWTGRGCGHAWSKWRAVHETVRRLRGLLTSLRMRRERRALGRWADVAASTAWMRSLVYRLHPANKGVRQAWNTWTQGSAARCLMRRVLAAVRHRHLRRGWNGWLRKGAMHQAAWRAVRRSGALLRSVSLGRAWRHWTCHFEWPRMARTLGLAFDGVVLRRALVDWRLCCQKGRGERALRKYAQLGRQAAVERTALVIEVRALEKLNARAAASMVTARAELASAAQHASTEQRRLARQVEAAEAHAATLLAELEEVRHATANAQRESAHESAAREGTVQALEREVRRLEAEATRAEETHRRADEQRLEAIAEAEAAQEAATDAVAAAEAALAQAAKAAAEADAEPRLCRRCARPTTAADEPVPPPPIPPPLAVHLGAYAPAPASYGAKAGASAPAPPSPQRRPARIILEQPADTPQCDGNLELKLGDRWDACNNVRREVARDAPQAHAPPHPRVLVAAPPPPAAAPSVELPPPSESLLRPTCASRGWDNSHRRAALEHAPVPPPMRSAGQGADTFSGPRFLEQVTDAAGRGKREPSDVNKQRWKEAARKTWGVREWGRASSNITAAAAALAYAPMASPPAARAPSAAAAILATAPALAPPPMLTAGRPANRVVTWDETLTRIALQHDE